MKLFKKIRITPLPYDPQLNQRVNAWVDPAKKEVQKFGVGPQVRTKETVFTDLPPDIIRELLKSMNVVADRESLEFIALESGLIERKDSVLIQNRRTKKLKKCFVNAIFLQSLIEWVIRERKTQPQTSSDTWLTFYIKDPADDKTFFPYKGLNISVQGERVKLSSVTLQYTTYQSESQAYISELKSNLGLVRIERYEYNGVYRYLNEYQKPRFLEFAEHAFSPLDITHIENGQSQMVFNIGFIEFVKFSAGRVARSLTKALMYKLLQIQPKSPLSTLANFSLNQKNSKKVSNKYKEASEFFNELETRAENTPVEIVNLPQSEPGNLPEPEQIVVPAAPFARIYPDLVTIPFSVLENLLQTINDTLKKQDVEMVKFRATLQNQCMNHLMNLMQFSTYYKDLFTKNASTTYNFALTFSNERSTSSVSNERSTSSSVSYDTDEIQAHVHDDPELDIEMNFIGYADELYEDYEIHEDNHTEHPTQLEEKFNPDLYLILKTNNGKITIRFSIENKRESDSGTKGGSKGSKGGNDSKGRSGKGKKNLKKI
jgi:hypothetical protein